MKVKFNKPNKRYTNRFSFDNNTTLGIGNVQPLFCKQIVGGSKISVNFGQLTRLSPLVVPSFARLKQRNDFCFVPMSMIMPSFDAFLSRSAVKGINKTYIPDSVPCITNQALLTSLLCNTNLCNCTMTKDGVYVKDVIRLKHIDYFSDSVLASNFLSSASSVPSLEQLPYSYFDFVFNSNDRFIDASSNVIKICVKLTQAGRFWYSVLRGLGYTLDCNDTLPVSILPLWAFAKAYYDLYYPKRSNAWHTSNYYYDINSFYNGYFNKQSVKSLTIDFVSSFDVLQPLFGSTSGFDFYATVDDSLATAATITPINSNSGAGNQTSLFTRTNFAPTDSYSRSFIVDNPGSTPSDSDLGSFVPTVQSTSRNEIPSGITADQLRLVDRLWSFVQKSSIVGQSVKDWFEVHLGVKTNEDMFDQSFLVKSVVNDVSINPVISTAQTSDGSTGDNLGALAGQGYGTQNSSINFEAKTFGYFMCLTSLVPVSGVSCGTQPELYCNTLYEQQIPDFDALGYEVLNMTSFNESQVSSNENTDNVSLLGGFGYVPRLSSWKSMHNIRSGNFALNSVKDSFLPYCADVLPTSKLGASILWRFPWSHSGMFLSFNRMFYNVEPDGRHFGTLPPDPVDDNFMSQSVFDVSYTSYLKPLSDSYSIESLGKDLVSVKEQ